MDAWPRTPDLPGYVTSEHTHAARAAWEAARDRGARPDQLKRLRAIMEGLWRRQADQFRAEFYLQRARRDDPQQAA